MNLQLWATMARPMTLDTVGRMIPGIVHQIDDDYRKKRSRRNGRSYQSDQRAGRSNKSGSGFWKWLGVILMVWGTMMMIPGPIDVLAGALGARAGIMIGSILFGPVGGLIGAVIGTFVGIALYNVFAVAVFTLGAWMTTW